MNRRNAALAAGGLVLAGGAAITLYYALTAKKSRAETIDDTLANQYGNDTGNGNGNNYPPSDDNLPRRPPVPQGIIPCAEITEAQLPLLSLSGFSSRDNKWHYNTKVESWFRRFVYKDNDSVVSMLNLSRDYFIVMRRYKGDHAYDNPDSRLSVMKSHDFEYKADYRFPILIQPQQNYRDPVKGAPRLGTRGYDMIAHIHLVHKYARWNQLTLDVQSLIRGFDGRSGTQYTVGFQSNGPWADSIRIYIPEEVMY